MKKNITIEFFRGLGALMVMTSHYINFIVPERNIFNFLWTGVYMFFVICGYVFSPYIFRRKKLIIKIFLIRRFFRIYPMYFLSLLLYFFIA